MIGFAGVAGRLAAAAAAAALIAGCQSAWNVSRANRSSLFAFALAAREAQAPSKPTGSERTRTPDNERGRFRLEFGARFNASKESPHSHNPLSMKLMPKRLDDEQEEEEAPLWTRFGSLRGHDDRQRANERSNESSSSQQLTRLETHAAASAPNGVWPFLQTRSARPTPDWNCALASALGRPVR